MPNESGLMSVFRTIGKKKPQKAPKTEERRFAGIHVPAFRRSACEQDGERRAWTRAPTRHYERGTRRHVLGLQQQSFLTRRESILHFILAVFSSRFAVKAFCVAARRATFPDGCVWMQSVRWFLGLYACYDYDIINTHSKWEWEQTGLVRMRRGLFINKMHSLKLCSLPWLISPGETEPSRPLHWPWHCPG